MKWTPWGSTRGSILMLKLHMASPWHQAGARTPCYLHETLGGSLQIIAAQHVVHQSWPRDSEHAAFSERRWSQTKHKNGHLLKKFRPGVVGVFKVFQS